VVGMRDALVAAPESMSVAPPVFDTTMRRRAVAGIRGVPREVVFVDVIFMNVVQVTVVEIVGVSFVGDRSVTAPIPMCVLMSGVIVACHGVLPRGRSHATGRTVSPHRASTRSG
jgi:hypothetical protein